MHEEYEEFQVVFAHYTNAQGPYVRARGAFPDSAETRERLKTQAVAALGGPLNGYRFTGSVLRGANPQGLVSIVAW